MKALPPIAYTDAKVTSSTAPEPGVGEQTWASGSTYAKGDEVILGSPSSTVTITIASPGVVTWNANGLPDGTPVVFTTTGTLPTGITAGTIYYVLNRATNSFQLSQVPGGAPIVTTGSQSGTHTATAQIHRKYESAIASNTGNPPALDDGTKWIDVGPTNRWAMLDLERSTGTSVDSPLTVVITPGERVDAIGLVGMVADTVSITVTVSGSIVYSYSENLSTREISSWYEYCFKPFTYKASLARFDLPPYTNGVISVTLTRASGKVTCGGLILGQAVYVGRTLYGATADAENYSTATRDDYGNATLIKRRSVPQTSQQVRFDKADTSKLQALAQTLNATVALWSGLDDPHEYFESLLILGFYTRFSLNLDRPGEGLATIELQEV